MVWDRGQGTRLHDHGGNWCVEAVYRGEIEVTSYAVTGGDPDAHAAGRTPARALTLDEAMAGYTTGAAWAARAERDVGRIAPGLLADFVLWDDDPWTAPAGRLDALSVGATYVGGRPVV
jgi:predicted amidohydrolase YtcJ